MASAEPHVCHPHLHTCTCTLPLAFSLVPLARNGSGVRISHTIFSSAVRHFGCLLLFLQYSQNLAIAKTGHP